MGRSFAYVTYLQYSYRRNIVGAIIGRKKHKFLLKSEFTSITRESPCIFALHRPIEAPFQFRCASAEECDGWFNDIQGALRPYLEERSLAKKNLILSDAGNVASNMNSAFKTTTPIKMIDLVLSGRRNVSSEHGDDVDYVLSPRLLSWSLHILEITLPLRLSLYFVRGMFLCSSAKRENLTYYHLLSLTHSHHSQQQQQQQQQAEKSKQWTWTVPQNQNSKSSAEARRVHTRWILRSNSKHRVRNSSKDYDGTSQCRGRASGYTDYIWTHERSHLHSG